MDIATYPESTFSFTMILTKHFIIDTHHTFAVVAFICNLRCNMNFILWIATKKKHATTIKILTTSYQKMLSIHYTLPLTIVSMAFKISFFSCAKEEFVISIAGWKMLKFPSK